MQQMNYHNSMPSNEAENCQWTANYNPPAPFAYHAAMSCKPCLMKEGHTHFDKQSTWVALR